MIPSISYPDATAKVRVITLQDQLIHTAKTLHKADTCHIDTIGEFTSIDHITPERELVTTDNILTHIGAFFCIDQTTEQTNTGEEVQLIYSGPFIKFRQDGSALNKGS